MNRKLLDRRHWLFLASLAFLLAGCQTDAPPTVPDATAETAAPRKLPFHKSEDFTALVKRIRALHQQIVSDDALPTPRKVEYVEVIHGTGASAHSHYYSAAEWQADTPDDSEQDPEHDSMEEQIKQRSYEVDVQTELADQIQWMAGLAADSDLDEADWVIVNEASRKLTEAVEAASATDSDDTFRDAWRARAADVNGVLAKLEAMVTKGPE